MALLSDDNRGPSGATEDVSYPPGPLSDRAHAEGSAPVRSLIDDIEAFIDDGRTYLNAELTYQKTRASFVTNRAGKTAVFGIGAAVLGLLAGIGLTVGLIIALTPLITAWGATAVVVGVLLLGAFLLMRRASSNWTSARQAMRSGDADEVQS